MFVFVFRVCRHTPPARSAAHLSNGDAASALADGEACVAAKPDWPKAYSRQGAALHALKR